MTILEISAKVSEIILIGFYREDTGEKLLIPEELVEALKQERLRGGGGKQDKQNRRWKG
ncbi:hypothetical protein [Nostoc sp.]|uniref:hypothetical protein n=1 Tax=Nostoc sp. TaxID=1180 RepID=UPI002FFC8310